jgi:hypothetical protein
MQSPGDHSVERKAKEFDPSPIASLDWGIA